MGCTIDKFKDHHTQGTVGGRGDRREGKKGADREKLLPFNYDLHKLPHLNLTMHYHHSPSFTVKFLTHVTELSRSVPMLF